MMSWYKCLLLGRGEGGERGLETKHLGRLVVGQSVHSCLPVSVWDDCDVVSFKLKQLFTVCVLWPVQPGQDRGILVIGKADIGPGHFIG